MSNDKLLNEDEFWNIVDSSLKNSNDIDEQEFFLITELEKLSEDEIIGFKLTLNKLATDIDCSEMWCAGSLMNGGCSDDGFDYFKNWVVSRGKDTYQKAKENPDYLVNDMSEEQDYYEFESFDYVAVNAFKNKTGNDLYDCLPENNYCKEDFELNWDEDDDEDEDSMKAICPKIFEKVGW